MKSFCQTSDFEFPKVLNFKFNKNCEKMENISYEKCETTFLMSSPKVPQFSGPFKPEITNFLKALFLLEK